MHTAEVASTTADRVGDIAGLAVIHLPVADRFAEQIDGVENPSLA